MTALLKFFKIFLNFLLPKYFKYVIIQVIKEKGKGLESRARDLKQSKQASLFGH